MYNNFKKNKAGKKQCLTSLSEVRLRIIQLTFLFIISILSWSSTYAETLISQQQNNTITGTVTDNSGESLVGVTVQIKGTTLGTVTDVDGRYILTNLSDDAILVFSYVGFLTEEYAIDGKSTLDVIMMPNIETLGEFVVIGYGVQRKLDVTSSISTINVDDLKSTPTISTESYLQGRAAGIFVASNTGAPGSTISVKIRGMVTTGNSEPLYIVDGMPMASGGGDNKFGINSLNPNDIESIQILKDASSAAIYGSRGSNGVVLITTKRGQSGKPTINLNTYYGFQSQARRIDVLNKEQYKAYYDLLGSSAPQYDDFDDPDLFAALPDFDWQNEIFTTAPTANAQLSVSGGSENSTYLISMGNTNQEGLVQGSNFNRTNLRINSDHKITNWLKFGESLSISYFRRNRIKEGGVGYSFPTAPPIIAALLSDPTTEAYDEDGNWNYMRHSGTFNGAGLRDRSSYLYTNKKLNGNLFFEITPFEGLLFKSSFGLDYNLGETREFMPSFNVEGSNLNEGQVAPTLKQSDAHGTYMITEQTLNYNKTLGDHYFNIMGGFTAEMNDNYFISGSNIIPGNAPFQQYLSAGNDFELTRSIGGGASQWRMYSYLGRLNYSLKDKYLVTGSIRRDASSRFGPNNRAGIFPAVSAAWKLSNEGFLQQISWLSQAKIRVGWGQVGNQNNIGNYSYNTAIQPGADYIFGNPKLPVTGLTAGVINAGYGGKTGGKPGNRSLTWETTETTNFGIDLSMFNNKFTVTADYFFKDNSGMLIESSVPEYLGITGPDINGGKIANQGFEVETMYKKYEGDFNFELGFNITHINTWVVDMDNTKFSNTINSFDLSRTLTGGGIADFWGLKTDGTFKSEEEIINGPFQNNGTKVGDIRFVDMNKDGKIDENDYTVIGSPLPDLMFGFTTNFFYKNFDLNIFMQGVHGNQVYNNLYRTMMGRWGVNHHVDILDSWTEENNTSDIPRFDETSQNNNLRVLSDRWIEDGAYLRLKTVSLGYTIPVAWASRMKVQSLRVYLTANNIYTFTKYKGFDPEVSQNVDWGSGGLDMGIDNGNYPMPRTLLFGLDFTF